jgi:hypothetical protein
MTINPKLKIASGVALAGGGAFMFYQSSKATDKKKKLMYGIAGGALIIGGFFAGKKGVIQVMGLREQGKAVDKSNEPAKGIIADMSKEEVEVKKPTVSKNNLKRDEDGNTIRTATLAFNKGEKNSDSFDSIMRSNSTAPADNRIRTVPSKQPNIVVKDKNGNAITANRNEAVRTMGVRTVGKIDPAVLEKNRLDKQALLNSITAKESEHKKLIKLSGWHAGLPLRNEISMLKARLHYV